MKNQVRLIVSALFFSVCLMVSPNIFAQGKFDVKGAGVETEVKGAAKFSELLLRFMAIYMKVEGKRIVSEEELNELVQLGQNVKNGASGFRTNLQGLVTKLKNGNRWNEQLDKEFTDSISTPNTKQLFQNAGARKILGTEVLSALNSLNADIDEMINDLRSRRAATVNQEISFEKASASRSAAKKGLKCFLLGASVAVAELAGAKLTAENIDKIFDKKCGGAGAATT